MDQICLKIRLDSVSVSMNRGTINVWFIFPQYGNLLHYILNPS